MKISGILEAPDVTITIMRLPIQNLVCDKCEPKMVELVELSSKLNWLKYLVSLPCQAGAGWGSAPQSVPFR